MKQATKDAIRRELAAVSEIVALAESEGRDLTGEEKAKSEAHIKAAGGMREREQMQDELRQQVADLSDGIDSSVPAPEQGLKAVGPAAQERRGGSTGHAFVNSAEYKAMLASVPDGRFGEKSMVQSAPYRVKGLITGTSETSAGSLVNPQQLGMLDPFWQRPLTIRQLVTAGTTATDLIEFVRQVSVTNAAAPVAEATTSAGPTQDGSTGALVQAVGGGYKPESGMVFERDDTAVRTIAHWIPATKRALSDAGQIKAMIDAFLLYGLEEELEDQMISGTGVGENLLGIAATSGIQTQAAPTGAQTNLDVLRMARRKVIVGGRANPTAYAMNPIDWEGIELMKDAQLRYLGAGPFQMTPPTLWSLPVVESEAIPAGTVYVGDWRQAVLWDREQASVQITDSHQDYFIRNLVAILAELRAAFCVLRPAAFVKVTLA